MEQVTVVQQDFAEELLVGCLQQLVERRQIRRTVTGPHAAPEEGVDSLSVGRLDEAAPCTRCIEQLGDDDRPVDGLQRLATHAVGAQDS